jgi:hypothetical protein
VRLAFKIGVRLPDEVSTLKRTEAFSEFDQGDFYIVTRAVVSHSDQQLNSVCSRA